jgi:hypothetical protein
MAWARFTKAFNFTPAEDRRSSVHYLAGYAMSVRADCKKAAIAAGAAVHFPAPEQGDDRIRLSANGVRFIPPELL